MKLFNWDKKTIVYDILQILAFITIVIVDISRCSGGGVTWHFTNMITGICFAVLILTCFKEKVFKRVWPLWIGVGVVSIAAFITTKYWFYKIPGLHYGETRALIFNIALGIIIVAQLLLSFKEYRKNATDLKGDLIAYFQNRIIFLPFVLFEVFACFSDFTIHKPAYTLIWAVLLVLTPFSKEDKKKLASNMLTGIILGFWFTQAIAFGVRPYFANKLRYKGIYFNANMFALMCYITMVASLLKIYELKKKVFWQVLLAVGSLANIAFMVFAVARASVFVSVVTLAAFVFYVFLVYEKKPFWKPLLTVIVAGVGTLIMIPVIYLSIRYLPTILHHGVYFGDEYLYWQDMDLRNPEVYATPKQAMDEILNRVQKLYGDNSKPKDEMDEIIAAGPLDPDWKNKEYYLNWDGKYNSFELRIAIWRTFLHKISPFGAKNAVAGEFLSPYKQYYHAHNFFIEMLYGYGGIAGGFFLIWIGLCLVKSCMNLKREKKTVYGLIPFSLLLAVLVFGAYEVVWQLGQISWFLIIFLQIFLMDYEKKKEK